MAVESGQSGGDMNVFPLKETKWKRERARAIIHSPSGVECARSVLYTNTKASVACVRMHIQL